MAHGASSPRFAVGLYRDVIDILEREGTRHAKLSIAIAKVNHLTCNDLSTIFDAEPADDLTVPTPGKITADRTPQIDVVNYADEDTSPIFFYHCRYDKYVPVRNTWLLAQKLDEYDVPFELHVFQSGQHGMSVNNRLTEAVMPIDSSVTQWVPLCVAWLDKLFA